MKIRYTAGVIIAIAVIVVNQLFIQYWLQQKNHEASVLNIAGRQRMYSQRINLMAHQVYLGELSTSALLSEIKEWENAHMALIHGNEELGDTPIESEIIIADLEKLTPQIEKISNKILLQPRVTQSLLLELNEDLDVFLIEMNQIVSLLEIDAESKLNFIVFTEIFLAVISMVIITLEVIFIYKPISEKLRQQVKQLDRNKEALLLRNKRLREIAYLQSHEVRRPLANILGITRLIKLDSKKENLMIYKQQLEESSKQLDEIIHKITKNASTID